MHDHSYESFSVCIFMDVDRLSDFTPTHPKVLPLMLHIFNKVYPDMIETNYGHQKRKVYNTFKNPMMFNIVYEVYLDMLEKSTYHIIISL